MVGEMPLVSANISSCSVSGLCVGNAPLSTVDMTDFARVCCFAASNLAYTWARHLEVDHARPGVCPHGDPTMAVTSHELIRSQSTCLAKGRRGGLKQAEDRPLGDLARDPQGPA